MKILKFQGIPFRQIYGVKTYPEYSIFAHTHGYESIKSTKKEVDLIQEIWNRIERRKNDT